MCVCDVLVALTRTGRLLTHTTRPLLLGGRRLRKFHCPQRLEARLRARRYAFVVIISTQPPKSMGARSLKYRDQLEV